MAVPTYDELLDHCDVEKSIMKQTVDDKHLRQFSLMLDIWETLAKFLEIPTSDIANIKSQGDAVGQSLKMLEFWKQRRGSMATYEAMVRVLLQISRTDLAEKVISLRRSSRNTSISTLETSSKQSQPCLNEPNLTLLTPSDSSNESSKSALQVSHSAQHIVTQKVITTLTELENEFYKLVTSIEATLKKSNVQIDIITRRFSMLPQSIRRRHQTDEMYTIIRQKILDSDTVKRLFDNLTALKHWNYMTPDTLAHILKDVEIDDIHKEINKYKEKLLAFKETTKLKELINTSFPVPDYCIELTMEVEGWEDKTIQEVENSAVNIVRRAAYSGSPHVRLGWKGVDPGSINVTFILMESLRVNPERIFEKDNQVISIQVDGNKYIKAVPGETEVPGRLWYKTAVIGYNAAGGRDVLILAPDLSLPHPEAVARRPGQLTQEDKLRLLKQGLPPKAQNELDIIKARYRKDKDCSIVKFKSGGSISYKEVLGSIEHLLNTTENDGVVLYYIGAGRRGTGDWCFEDGFITFRDIAQLYLKASQNFKGFVLTIISDCSYSGCWVRDCMEFLDEQGIQPCGHKAREKGMIIKVFASCKSYQIPTEYSYLVSGVSNDIFTGKMEFWISKQLLKSQTIDTFNSSFLHCKSKTIDEPCTLPPGLTWKMLRD